MTGRLAARAADAEALLARFNDASDAAMQALDARDGDALSQALDVRDELQQEIERAVRDMTSVRARFAPDTRSAYVAPRVVDRALERYCAPLEELTRAAQALQERLEASASQLRDGIAGELASLETVAGAAARYAGAAVADPHRLDVLL